MQNNNLANEIAKLGIASLVGFLGGYYLDPDTGRRRRALFRDQISKANRSIKRQGKRTKQDVTNRFQGSLHELTSRFSDYDIDDQSIKERVKAVIGHYTSHPSAIHIAVSGQVVNLSGDIIKKEVMPLLWAVRTVKGVKSVNNNLTLNPNISSKPNLQGEGRTSTLIPINREYWPPAYRAAMGMVSATLTAYGLANRELPGALAVTTGSLLMLRTIMNESLRSIFGIGSGSGVITVQKSITINAPKDKVYDMWLHPENFPTFMTNVHRVESIGEDKYIWTVAGPAFTEVHWTAVVTHKDSQRICWETVPNSAIEQIGQVYFEDHGDSTTVHIQIAYNPLAGAFGHLIAYLFRSDPKTDLDEDMLRMKTILETGKIPRGAHSQSA
ncbi:MAG: SRPBCC family protein [Oligoflexus sp.]